MTYRVFTTIKGAISYVTISEIERLLNIKIQKRIKTRCKLFICQGRSTQLILIIKTPQNI